MENSEKTLKQTPWSIIIVIIAAIIAVVFWQLSDKKEAVVVPIAIVKSPLPTPSQTPEPIIEKVDEIVLVEPEPIMKVSVIEEPIIVPLLNESDEWVAEKLPELTWRKELLKLMVNDDIIRRFVVFSDNFSRGYVAYEYSSFVPPTNTFFAQEKLNSQDNTSQWVWDEKSTQRFNLYVELLRSIDVDLLVKYYNELKPLIDDAYQELGYEGDFNDVAVDMMNKILDMELPKDEIILTRESVMYKFADPALEGLDEADKLLLRLGKDNLLVLKAIVLEVNAKVTSINDE